MTPELAKICADLEILIVAKTKRRQSGQTFAIKTMERMLAEHGEAHLTLVLRSIVETGNNCKELVSPTMWAISDIILAHPFWTTTSAWLDAMDTADLAQMRVQASANRRAAQPRPAIATMLFAHLSKALGHDGK